MLRIIEWIGYIICLGSVLANGLIRHMATIIPFGIELHFFQFS